MTRILYKNNWDNYTIDSNSEDANYPAINTVDTSLSKVWHSVGVSAEWISLDCGAGVTINPTVAVIAGHNISESAATIKIQGDDDSDFSSLAVDESFTHAEGNMVKFFTGSALRYWKFLITDETNNSGYISIGRLFLGTYLETDNAIFISFPYNIDDTSLTDTSLTGQLYGDEGVILRKYDLSIPLLSDTNRKALDVMYKSVKVVKPIFFVFDHSDLTTITPLYSSFTKYGYSHGKSNLWNLKLSIKEAK